MVTTHRPFNNAQEIASLIDHTLLKPEATEADVIVLCEQALEYQFASVCVNPWWVPLVDSRLRDSKVKTCCVVGFPLGANRIEVKTQEASLAIKQGALEVDMVMNVGALRSGDSDHVAEEIQRMVFVLRESGAAAILKVILETCLLNDQQKVQACRLAMRSGADFVKTSTGFSSDGATEADVTLMRAAVGLDMGVKASGGVRTLEALTRMVHAGANRIGTSAGVQIITEFQTGVAGAGSGY